MDREQGVAPNTRSDQRVRDLDNGEKDTQLHIEDRPFPRFIYTSLSVKKE